MKPAIVALLALWAIPSFAAPKHWFTDKKWWFGEAVIVTSVALDSNSSCGAVHRGGAEQNIFLPPHPSCGQIAAVGIGAGAYWTVFHAIEWHISHDDPNKAWRVVGYTAMPIAAAAIHGSAAAHNYSVNEQPAAFREGLVRP